MPEGLVAAPSPPAVRPLDTRVLGGFAGAEGLWADVLAGDGAATFFAGHAWQSAWWRHHGVGCRLLLVAVHRGERPAGIGPFLVSRAAGCTVVRFVGSGVSDYADVLVNETVATRREVVFAALDAVRARHPDAVLDLEQVPEHGGTVGLVAEWAAARGYRLHRAVQDRCPYQRLPADEAVLEAGFSQSTRRQDRRNRGALRRLGPVRLLAFGAEAGVCGAGASGAGACGGEAAGPGGLAALVDTMAEIEAEHPAADRRTAAWQNARRAFLTDALSGAAAAGELWLSGLWVGETMVAYSVAFRHGDVLYGYVQAYRRRFARYGPGSVLLLHLQREAVRHGIRTLDYLRGPEPYKMRWQSGVGLNHRLLLRPSAAGPGARAAALGYLVRAFWPTALRELPAARRAVHAVRGLLRPAHR
jgi:CelD/BcsL family acetyltransferase involved in cellulose biosynthesis